MAIRPIKGIKSIFNALAGKWGPKPAIWTGVAVIATGAAIGIGIAIPVVGLPLTAIYSAASLFGLGITSGVNAAGAASSHKHFAKITELEEKNLALQEDNLRMEKQLLSLLEARPAPSGPAASGPKPA